jgi:uncharacterized surface protein with fasciclin (FAS1) repeats
MYAVSMRMKNVTLGIFATCSLLIASASFAGPGKPGKNEYAEDGTIVDIALAVNEDNGQFSNLLTVVGCFGPLEANPIVDLLSGDDKYTLFAPTDAAFASLLERLEVTNPCVLIDNDDPYLSTLFTVLAYHVVDGRRFSNSVFNARNAKMIETLAGVDITSYVDMGGTPKLMDVDGQEIGIVSPLFNINAINGVIHVIDTVLLPIDLPDEE